MKPPSVRDDAFLQAVQRLLAAGEILVVVRYAYAAGSRDYLFLNEMGAFRRLLDRLGHRDSVVVMTSFRKVIEGRVDDAMIAAAESAYPTGAYWLVLDENPPQYQARDYLIESRAELLDELESMLGRQVRIIEEPQFTSEEHSINAYIPDKDGVVRVGAY